MTNLKQTPIYTLPLKFSLNQDGTWKEVEFDKQSNQIIGVNDRSNITLDEVKFYDCYDSEGKKVFWIGMDSDQRIVRVEWNAQTSTKPEFWRYLDNSKRQVIPHNININFDYSQQALQNITTSYQESKRAPSELLTLNEVNNRLIRPADAVVREQLIATNETMEEGGDELVVTKKKVFIKKFHEKYTEHVKQNLTRILQNNPDSYSQLKQALNLYLEQHWNNFGYISESPATNLLNDIARRLNLENPTEALQEIQSAFTPKILGDLNCAIAIENATDLRWLCTLPPQIMIAHFLREDDRNPKAYLNQHYTDFDSFQNFLVLTPPEAHPILLSHTNIQLNAEQLNTLLKAFDEQAMIEILQDKLPEIIQNGDDLKKVLQDLADEPSTRILNIMKGKLPHMMTQDHDVDQKIKTALQGSKQGFFATPRAEKINVGSLTSKLEKYIETRKEEYSFHWDFLHIMTALNWLFGEAFVQSKETKLNAANYALLSHTHPDQCLVKLQCLDQIPDETELSANHKNSYLLIGNNDSTNVLYYIDYEGKSRAVRIQTSSEANLVQFFTSHANQSLTYQEVNQGLNDKVAHKLPTDAQLEALKEG